jgi:hypothetical protein
MNIMCKFCKTKYFILEMPSDKKFSNCCHKEKIKLVDDVTYPKLLQKLINNNSNESKQFFKNIRTYNNALAFASFGAKLVNLKTKGPQVFRISGQDYHNTYSLHPEDEKFRKFGQLYIIDNEIAKYDSYNTNCNSNLSIELLTKIEQLLKEINPYCKAYKMMHEIEEVNKNALKNNTVAREIKMFITRNKNLYKNICNLPTCNEVAVVFVGEEGEPPIDRDFCVYSKDNKPQRIPIISQHVDPMTYPLIFPYGEFGWRPY